MAPRAPGRLLRGVAAGRLGGEGGARSRPSYEAGERDAVDVGQAHGQRDHVRPLGSDHVHGLGSRARLTDEDHVRLLLDQPGQAVADQRVLLDDCG
jgi:hypothetical protein